MKKPNAKFSVAKLRWNVELDEGVGIGEDYRSSAILTTNQRGKPQSQTTRLPPPNPQQTTPPQSTGANTHSYRRKSRSYQATQTAKTASLLALV